VYFLAAAEELNFTRAARRLHVVPQALSTAIAQLEDVLGVRLFDRTPRRVALTG
jgi:DNA-binding transcriptional LysR family regulator